MGLVFLDEAGRSMEAAAGPAGRIRSIGSAIGEAGPTSTGSELGGASFGSGKMKPQNRHLRASARTSSAQSGHFLSPGAVLACPDCVVVAVDAAGRGLSQSSSYT
jgi:hypothetical protein